MENRRQVYQPNDLQVRQHRSAVLFVPPAVTATTLAIQATSPAAPSAQWVRGKNLDFCLLAVCSCILAVLCHQTVHLPSAQTAPTSTLAASSRVLPSQLDFLVKAGLFTSSHASSEAEEEGAE